MDRGNHSETAARALVCICPVTFFRTSASCDSSRTMIPKCRIPARMQLFYFEDGEELMLAEFEKGVAFAAVEFLEIEDVLVKRDRLLDVVHLDGDVIAAVNLHAHQLRNRALNASCAGQDRQHGDLWRACWPGSCLRISYVDPEAYPRRLKPFCRWRQAGPPNKRRAFCATACRFQTGKSLMPRAAGVKEPERIRLLQVDTIPSPTHPMLKAAYGAINLITSAPRGLTFHYGIFVRSDCRQDRNLLVHELVHTSQSQSGSVEFSHF